MTLVTVDVCSAKAAEGALQCTGVREVVFVERVSCAWRVCGWSSRQMHSSLTLALLVHHLPTTLSRIPSKSDVMSRLCRVLISRCGFQATFLITAGKFCFQVSTDFIRVAAGFTHQRLHAGLSMRHCLVRTGN